MASCILVPALATCDRTGGSSGREPTAPRVTVYSSVDEVFARQVLDDYRTTSGVEVALVPDSEAGKTTGLVARIITEAETGRPRADVFWSSELLGTMLLARRGLLETHDPPTAADIPPRFRDAQHRWTACAARARVLAYDPAQVAPTEVPVRWEDLAKPELARQTALANPLFGTTRGHVAAMFALWGPERGRAFLTALHDGGARIVDGNSAAVREVLAGRARFAMTDTDDVWLAQRSGASLNLRYLDMGDGGTLLIPCSVGILKGAPNLAGARKLVDYLVSARVERLLAESASRNLPVRPDLRSQMNLDWPPESSVEYDAIADALGDATAAVRDILLR